MRWKRDVFLKENEGEYRGCPTPGGRFVRMNPRLRLRTAEAVRPLRAGLLAGEGDGREDVKAGRHKFRFTWCFARIESKGRASGANSALQVLERCSLRFASSSQNAPF